MPIVSLCISDKSPINYEGQVIDNSHVLVGGDKTPNKPIIVTTDPTSKPTVIVKDDTETTPNYPTIFVSTKTKSFKKDCSTGFTGTLVPYTVTVNSLISQNDADTKALTKLQLEGQANAQAVGLCQCSLVWVPPTLTYQTDSVKVRVVINNATEYRLGNEVWQAENEFIITTNGEYIIYARNGTLCEVFGIVNINIDQDNSIYNIKLKGFTCDRDTPDGSVIDKIKLITKSCGTFTDQGIYNLKLVQSACSQNDAATITNIKLIRAC